MKIAFERYVPLGLDYHNEVNGICAGLLIATLLSLGFPIRYSHAYSRLFELINGKRVLIETARMESFSSLLSGSLTSCFLFALCALALIPYHYYYHYQGSKSIYLMRRLPSRPELWRRCLSAPLAAAAGFLLLAALLLLLYFTIYQLCTPDACLLSGQWAALWTA